MVKVMELSKEAFEKYGTYTNMLSPAGCKIGNEPCEFYRDMIFLDQNTTSTAFSVCRVLPRPLSVTELEYHNNTGEIMLPLDGDIYIPLAPACGKDVPCAAEVEVFRVPSGTIVSIRKGVWHCGAYAAGSLANVLIALPERTYFTDCYVRKMDGPAFEV